MKNNKVLIISLILSPIIIYAVLFIAKFSGAKYQMSHGDTFIIWILIAILIISSVNYITLTLIFEYPIKYGTLMFSAFITFLIYPVLSKLFDKITLIDSREENAK